MSSTSLFNLILLILLFPILSCQSVEKVIDQNFNKEQKIPEISDIENVDNIHLGSSIFLNNFDKGINLTGVKHIKNRNLKLQTFFLDDKFYTINSNSTLYINNQNNGELLDNYKLVENIDNDNLVSYHMFNNYFILGYSSGKIIKVDLNGKIIWTFDNKKIFNSFIYLIDDLIIALYADEILALRITNGEILWSETYKDLPIIQSKGGQLVNFFDDIYFILPNGRLGLIDLNLGEKNYNKFVNLNIQNSINNANDKIHIFKNFLFYLDEGEFLYTFDLFSKSFLLENLKINSSSSNKFFNNTLIIKNEQYLEAINILNGKTFWLIESKLHRDSKILNIKNVNGHLTIFMDDGKIAIIKEGIVSEILDLKIKKLNSFYFSNDKIITIQKNGKIGVF
tara:strand:- start:282 stop:1466 length:1185 start_codon:yes stop_codon:yes gene_type:complete